MGSAATIGAAVIGAASVVGTSLATKAVVRKMQGESPAKSNEEEPTTKGASDESIPSTKTEQTEEDKAVLGEKVEL